MLTKYDKVNLGNLIEIVVANTIVLVQKYTKFRDKLNEIEKNCKEINDTRNINSQRISLLLIKYKFGNVEEIFTDNIDLLLKKLDISRKKKYELLINKIQSQIKDINTQIDALNDIIRHKFSDAWISQNVKVGEKTQHRYKSYICKRGGRHKKHSGCKKIPVYKTIKKEDKVETNRRIKQHRSDILCIYNLLSQALIACINQINQLGCFLRSEISSKDPDKKTKTNKTKVTQTSGGCNIILETENPKVRMKIFATNGYVEGQVNNPLFRIQTTDNAIALVILEYKNKSLVFKIKGRVEINYNTHKGSMQSKSYSQNSSIDFINASSNEMKQILKRYNTLFQTNLPHFYSKTYKKQDFKQIKETFKKAPFIIENGLPNYISKFMHIVECGGAGNCLFLSVARQVAGKTHQQLRKDAVNWLEKNKNINDGFKDLFANDKYAKQYFQRMKQLGEWGGHNEIIALANVLKRTIVVITQYDQVRPQVIRPIIQSNTKNSEPPIFIFYRGGNHYQALLLNRQHNHSDNEIDLKMRVLNEVEKRIAQLNKVAIRHSNKLMIDYSKLKINECINLFTEKKVTDQLRNQWYWEIRDGKSNQKKIFARLVRGLRKQLLAMYDLTGNTKLKIPNDPNQFVIYLFLSKNKKQVELANVLIIVRQQLLHIEKQAHAHDKNKQYKKTKIVKNNKTTNFVKFYNNKHIVKTFGSGPSRPSLELAFNLFRLSCVCGKKYSNNCAHFLSDALIRAGFLGLKNNKNMTKCSSGRPIRAKELLKYAKNKKTSFCMSHDTQEISGVWFVYNEYKGQGHVCLHREYHDTYDYQGTGDAETFQNWPVQWHYKF
ncbi:MAG: hypothetical protein PVI75_07345 [Gammaproteobacteria bacterium]|jgi:hypothetical protein